MVVQIRSWRIAQVAAVQGAMEMTLRVWKCVSPAFWRGKNVGCPRQAYPLTVISSV